MPDLRISLDITPVEPQRAAISGTIPAVVGSLDLETATDTLLLETATDELLLEDA